MIVRHFNHEAEHEDILHSKSCVKFQWKYPNPLTSLSFVLFDDTWSQ